MATIHKNDRFDAGQAAIAFAKAFKGLGTNEAEVIRLLTTHTLEQRLSIAAEYKRQFEKELVVSLRSELKGDFQHAAIAMMTTPHLFAARQLRLAMKGVGTDESTLIEIVFPRTDEEISAIKVAYRLEFQRELVNDIKTETKTVFQTLLVAQCSDEREHGRDVDSGKAKTEAKILHEADAEQWNKPDSSVVVILCYRSFPQLKATFKAYKELAGKDIEETITKSTKGNVQKGYLALARFCKEPSRFFAMQLNNAMQGLGTKEETLTRIIVCRSEIDLKKISFWYRNLFKRPLHVAIKKDTSGDYEKLLLAIVGTEEQECHSD